MDQATIEGVICKMPMTLMVNVLSSISESAITKVNLVKSPNDVLAIMKCYNDHIRSSLSIQGVASGMTERFA